MSRTGHQMEGRKEGSLLELYVQPGDYTWRIICGR